MKVRDQKEEESPTPDVNYTVMQDSSLTEVEKVVVLIIVYFFFISFFFNHHKKVSNPQQWNTSGQAGIWPSVGPTFTSRYSADLWFNCMKSTILTNAEGTVIVIGAG